MQAQIRIGRECIPMSKFAIGDAVLHWVDTQNSPDGDWRDAMDTRDRFYWWYRGIVVGVEFDYRLQRQDQQSPWVYKVRIFQSYDGLENYGWERKALKMLEHEIKRSAYTARQFRHPEHPERTKSLAVIA